MDLLTFVAQLQRDQAFEALASNPSLQFGTEADPYLGANLLPERLVNQNMYRETAIRWTTTIAHDGTRYGPVQMVGTGAMHASWAVELAHQDAGSEFTSRDYDALIDMLDRIRDGATADNPEMQAAADTVLAWANTTLLRSLLDLNEKHRWDAIIRAQVVRKGDNAYTETINYPNPTNHRAAAGGSWSDPAYDPWPDIVGMADLLSEKGYAVDAIITSKKVMRLLEVNPLMRVRFAEPIRSFSVPGLTVDNAFVRTNTDTILAGFERNNLPAPVTYERRYRDGTGVHRFVGDDTMVFVSTTGRAETVPILNGERFLPNTQGYFAIGRAAGQSGPGRVIRVTPYFNKPPRLEGEAWQAALPVITEPESIAVITDID